MSFLANLNWRYATKKFDTSKKVSDTDLEKIIEAIRLAPTSFGLQPYRVWVVTNPEIKEKIQAAAWGQPQITTSSHLLVFTARTDLSENKEEFFTLISGGNPDVRAALKGYEDMVDGFVAGKPTPESVLPWSAKQAYIAHGFALAACAELEIDSCAMEGFDPVAVGALLGLPASEQAVVMLPIGYRDASETPRPKARFSKEQIVREVK